MFEVVLSSEEVVGKVEEDEVEVEVEVDEVICAVDEVDVVDVVGAAELVEVVDVVPEEVDGSVEKDVELEVKEGVLEVELVLNIALEVAANEDVDGGDDDDNDDDVVAVVIEALAGAESLPTAALGATSAVVLAAVFESTAEARLVTASTSVLI